MTFEEEAHPRLRFDNNPLKIVVAQVRFDAVHRLASPEVLGDLQAALVEPFPRSLPAVQEITVTLLPQGPTQQVEQQAARFGDEGEKRIVAIGPEMASFETTAYRGWEDFQVAFRQVLDLLTPYTAGTRITRFGLRYVDEMHIEGVSEIAHWYGLLRDSLIGTVDSVGRDPRVMRTQQRVTLAIGDNVVNLRHGFARQGEDGDGRSAYVIDTDVSTTALGRWSADEVMARAERYHLWASNLFARSLTEAGIEKLGGTLQ